MVSDVALDEVVWPDVTVASLNRLGDDARESQFRAQIPLRPRRTYFVDSLYKS